MRCVITTPCAAESFVELQRRVSNGLKTIWQAFMSGRGANCTLRLELSDLSTKSAKVVVLVSQAG